MKKLKLSELKLGDSEVLTREELKKVLGGMGSGGAGEGGQAACCWINYPDDCSKCVDYINGMSCDQGQMLVTCVY